MSDHRQVEAEKTARQLTRVLQCADDTPGTDAQVTRMFHSLAMVYATKYIGDALMCLATAVKELRGRQ